MTVNDDQTDSKRVEYVTRDLIGQSYENCDQSAYCINSDVVDGSRSNHVREDLSSQYILDRFGFMHNLSYREPKLELDLVKNRRRESKWLHMLSNWSYFMNNQFDKVRSRCRKGIPSSLRGRAWKYLSGAFFHMELGVNRSVFEDFLSEEGDPNWIYQIEKDLNRQFPEHMMFSSSSSYGELGRKSLHDVLKAYTLLHPDEGYCQGQAAIAAVLLMHMPPRDAFYCLVQICNKYLPGYYSDELKTLLVDGDVLLELLKRKSKSSFVHLKNLRIEPAMYMIEWFMCIYCRLLPWPTLLRLWDIFFCEGINVLFRAAIILFQYGLSSTTQLQEFNTFCSVLNRLKNFPSDILTEEFFIKKVTRLQLEEVELQKIRLRFYKTRQMRSSD